MKIKLFLSLMLVGFMSFSYAQTAEQLAVDAIDQEIPLIKDQAYANSTLLLAESAGTGQLSLNNGAVLDVDNLNQMSKDMAIGAMLQISANIQQSGMLLQPAKDAVYSKMTSPVPARQAMMDNIVSFIEEVLN